MDGGTTQTNLGTILFLEHESEVVKSNSYIYETNQLHGDTAGYKYGEV